MPGNESGRRLNLNLLPLLDALLECRNVTRAGERFNLTQPAASAALAKLREAFGDELLVHVGREMKLTPKAERIREPVKQLLGLLASTIESNDMDPASWSGQFIVATADYIAILLLPRLLELTNAAAPKLTVRVTNITRSSVSNLRSDEIDMIVAPPQLVGDSSLMSRRLFRDRFVWIHRKDRPPRRGDAPDYMQEGHLATVIDAPQQASFPSMSFCPEIDALRATQRNLAVLPYYSLLPHLVAETGCSALVQERIARKFAETLPIAYRDPPVEMPPVDFHMFWSPRFNEDPRHVWLRNAIYETSESLR